VLLTRWAKSWAGAGTEAEQRQRVAAALADGRLDLKEVEAHLTPEDREELRQHHLLVADRLDAALADGRLEAKWLAAGLNADERATRTAQVTAIVQHLRSINRQDEEPKKMAHTKAALLRPGPGDGGPYIRVKGAGEAYRTERIIAKSLKFPQGRPDPVTGETLTDPSEYQHAVFGALLRHRAWASALPRDMVRPPNEHELALVEHSAEEDSWIIGDEHETKALSKMQVKALLSDSVSGGLQANPVWWDPAIVTFPLLHGEFMPYVETVEMPRGATIQGATLGNPTVTWGVAEATGIPVFNTSSLIGPLGGTVQPVAVAIEIGRDLMRDVPVVDLGRMVQDRVSERMLQELDRVIVSGNGTTEPLGILNTGAGVTVIPSDNGTSGPATVGDLEGLMFAVPKQYRVDSWNPAYFGNDISYRRAKAINVGPGDERRVLSPMMDHESYTVLGRPYRVNQSVANNQVGFGALAKFRLWRRQGFEFQWSIEGRYLMQNNLAALVVRGLFYAKVVDPSAFCLINDAQA
jgi:HK97 family phage major capsid protein